MKLEGEFTYEVDGEKVKSVDEFYKLTNNKNYNLVIDGLNIVATSKSEPFFLDEFVGISFSPKTSKKQKEDLELLRNIKLKNIYLGLEDVTKIMGVETEKELEKGTHNLYSENTSVYPNLTSNDTGGSVFEKVQDSTLDVYNAITGHSTRHKACKEKTINSNIENWLKYAEQYADNSINKPPKESAGTQAEKYISPFWVHNINKKESKYVDLQKGAKETENKVDYSEIDWDFIEQLAKRMSKNKDKYVVNNWKAPTDVEKLKQALLRHVLEVLKGNYADGKDELGHLEAIALNAQFLNYQIKNIK